MTAILARIGARPRDGGGLRQWRFSSGMPTYHSPHMQFTPAPHITQNWQLAKPAASGRRGMVVSQSQDAAEAGVAVLDAGGNAIDAAVATALALAAVEPWNSGLGGIGHAVVHRAGQARAETVDFGPTAPGALDPSRFKLTGRVDGRPVRAGRRSRATPTSTGRSRSRFRPRSRAMPRCTGAGASLPLAEIAAPAIALAKRGLPQDWYTALKVASRADPAEVSRERAHLFARRVAAVPPYQGAFHYFRLGNFTDTLERLAQAGWRDFYEGEIAASIVADVQRAWAACCRREDLRHCKRARASADRSSVARAHAATHRPAHRGADRDRGAAADGGCARSAEARRRLVRGARTCAEGRLRAAALLARRCRAAGGGKLHHAHHGRAMPTARWWR